MNPMEMSNTLREHLEGVLESLVIDRPYASVDAERRLIDILGYAIDEDGNQVPREEWYKP